MIYQLDATMHQFLVATRPTYSIMSQLLQSQVADHPGHILVIH